jgi:hypothetical protein
MNQKDSSKLSPLADLDALPKQEVRAKGEFPNAWLHVEVCLSVQKRTLAMLGDIGSRPNDWKPLSNLAKQGKPPVFPQENG